MEDDIHSNDVCVLYKPRSDFINLSKLIFWGLARKLEAMKRKESQRTPTMKRWIWENVVRVIDIIGSGMRMKWKMEPKCDGDMSLKILREKYTMGIVSESVSVTCILFKTLRSLSEEEWDWVIMTPEEAQDDNHWCGLHLEFQDQSGRCRGRRMSSLQHQRDPRERSMRKMFLKAV